MYQSTALKVYIDTPKGADDTLYEPRLLNIPSRPTRFCEFLAKMSDYLEIQDSNIPLYFSVVPYRLDTQNMNPEVYSRIYIGDMHDDNHVRSSWGRINELRPFDYVINRPGKCVYGMDRLSDIGTLPTNELFVKRMRKPAMALPKMPDILQVLTGEQKHTSIDIVGFARYMGGLVDGYLKALSDRTQSDSFHALNNDDKKSVLLYALNVTARVLHQKPYESPQEISDIFQGVIVSSSHPDSLSYAHENYLRYQRSHSDDFVSFMNWPLVGKKDKNVYGKDKPEAHLPGPKKVASNECSLPPQGSARGY